ncbi:PP0621 family protein [Noviherbaspirillum sedimenti]|uniref:Preprotein translocase subunit YajC n=1 Tax=Noviherbaspirillum sedimenti TaxID=2320865 RepID=A0A3A3G6Z9_9BURK|nr:PP0621 family protein [Noviherbaspirillum sedimenti]RJG03731.1 hypothetical protein D3878_20830 [Noviherbaspirillum sedimenti]
MKLLIWLVIAFLVLAWVMRSKKAPGPDASDQNKPLAPDRNIPPEPILQCARCGLHVPASEAVTHASGSVFCSEEHRRQSFPGA